ncbi:MAG: ABC transporter permease [Aquificae bacterium]|nr:ABC transporter permease [Aquificota bacterium]
MDLSSALKEVLLAYFLLLSVVLFDLKNGYGVWRELVPVSVLSFLQLLLIGFVILYLAQVDRPELTLLVVFFMTLNAALIARRRFRLKAYSGPWTYAFAFLAIAAVNYFLLLLYALVGILKVKAQFLVPFAGLLLAAGMRSLSLFSQYLTDLLAKERAVIEGMFALGAPPSAVRNYLLKKAVPLTTVVIRDMLKAAGIVHIPGVMVGMLLAGTHPLKAATMQFLVLSSMLFSMFFTPVVFYYLLTSFRGVFLVSPQEERGR